MILPLCRCGHGYRVHEDDDGVASGCLATECGCPFYVPSDPVPQRSAGGPEFLAVATPPSATGGTR